MAEDDLERRRPKVPVAAFQRLPTGARVFLILSIALLPLALIALFATLQTTRTVDVETRARLRVAGVEASRALANELVGDLTALRVALRAIDSDARDAPSCARVQGIFAQQSAAGIRFQVADATGRLLCGAELPVPVPAPTDPSQLKITLLPSEGLLVHLPDAPNGSRADAFFPKQVLADVARPSGFVPPYAAQLTRTDEVPLELQPLARRGPLDRRETLVVPLGFDDLSFAMSVRSAPITSPVLVAMLLPLLMWAAAAGIGWFVVDRLLIRPLRRLRTSVAAYTPGEVIGSVDYGVVPAQEISDLAETFEAITRTVQQHETNLADGLVRQTKLTREVHHRVKNNLQVIASLINFHARSASSAEASEAYAAIQRRVDALAVVHRHHFAELEENRGLELRAVIGELASNIRATAPEHAARMGITIDVEPLLVSQDVGVAVSFLLTELVELAMMVNPATQARISAKLASVEAEQVVLRVSSPALVESAELSALVASRYGRVLLGLSRQLRAPLHHDPLVGAYEIAINARSAR
ncbi:histidine kinase [Sphingomonas sp. PL-96]|uniref:sensor histidine kinase n=1 Tax=Sphingomonas sp. PL-96 TaxID=2887201 RepID=UPI001E52C852|nr:histidine kinase dimerization/phosphoacceptor domain -containing protein [Sphingomonas sp. PL-96]MCC2976964.1 histidine kinase [Sphingomonas sp. PL-96]